MLFEYDTWQVKHRTTPINYAFYCKSTKLGVSLSFDKILENSSVYVQHLSMVWMSDLLILQ